MANFGQMLGAFGTAYPQYQAQQQDHQMNQLKIQQALRQMQMEQENRKAQGEALKSFGGMQGAGPGGAITPQQYAQASGGNPEAFNMIRQAANPYNSGQFNLQGRQITGEYGLDRTAMQGDNRMNAVNAQQAGANERVGMRGDNRMDEIAAQQAGANARNKYSVDNRKSSAANPANLATQPEYRTAKTEYDQAKQDERAIARNYQMNPAQAYSDPQWLDARKRSVAAQKKLESIQSKSTKKTETATPKAEPLPAGAEKFPDGTEIPDDTGAVWVKQGNQLIPKQ